MPVTSPGLTVAAAACLLAAAVLVQPQSGRAEAKVVSGPNILTYHYDNLRTGWNQAETQLTPATVASANFGLLAQVALDEQVDAQPLYVSNQAISGHGKHNVVYVATENNSIYAIDAATGTVLLQQNYGMPVPISALPGGCNNNSNNIGINSTPVIDPSTNTLYAVTYTYENNVQTFRIHAIDLTTLQDQVPSVVVSGTAAYKNGKTATFNAASQRQRPGLVETGGNIYAGFGSFCDIGANTSRGWVLGWNTGTLAPLPVSRLMDQRQVDQDQFYLTSVWMSGYGIAADDAGSLYFITGNSDYNGKSYGNPFNLDESVVRLSTDLTTVQDFFTPRSGPNGWSSFDQVDNDFGSAGVLLLPPQSGSVPNLAVAAGKGGPLYLMNRDSLGGLVNAKSELGSYTNWGCWCGQSYFVGSDGVGRVVQSNGYEVIVYKVQTSPKLALLQESVSPGLNDDQDPGFFTTISSNGTTADTAVIWAATRPSASNADSLGVYLQAIDPANGSAVIFAADAGDWPFAGNANANVVPVTANGHVFVATYQNLSIYGLAPVAAHKVFQRVKAPPMPAFPGVQHEIRGIVSAVEGDMMTLRERDGTVVQVDIAAARRAGNVAASAPGHAVLVRGDDGRNGTLEARFVLHQKNAQVYWPADR